ncbi:hypothetical protein EV368DRAFT_66658, partial [Lentinula lateritia]
MPPTLAVFDEWKDMHEAVRTIMEVNREHSNATNLLQLQMGEVRDRVPELEKEIAELRGRLSQATLHSPPPQPLPPLASNLIPPASLFTSPYASMPKHATVDFAQPGAKRSRHDPAYTDVLVEGVKSDEGTASLVRKILNATNTAFPTVIAGYRMNDPNLPPHVVVRFKAADSASQFVWIVTERCPRGLQGCRVSLMQRPSPQSTHSYEFLQPKNSAVGNQQSIRAPGYGPPDDISGLGSGPMGCDSCEQLDDGTTTFSSSTTHPQFITVVGWNIHGRLILKLHDPVFLQYVEKFDIVIVEETWLQPGQEDSLPLPKGYDIISSPRPDRLQLKRAGGGVAAIFRSSLDIDARSDLSTPDVVVVETPDYFLIGGYLLPSGSPYGDWSEIDPKESMASVITRCCSSSKPLFVLADLNGRTGNHICCADSPPRSSLDTVSNAR